MMRSALVRVHPWPALLLLTFAACGPRTTARLALELEQRFQAEGVLRRADDQQFRFTDKTYAPPASAAATFAAMAWDSLGGDWRKG